MDYEKAYKNLVTKVKNAHLYAQTDSTKNVLEDILPELAESDNERIRKKCIELIKRVIPSGDSQSQESKEILDCISYLEKQKPEIKYVYPKFRKGDVIEPITPNGYFTPVRVVGIWDGSYSCRSDDGKAYLSLPIKQEDEYRLVEQKPIEDVVKDITKNKESATKFLKSAGIMDRNGELSDMYRPEQKPVWGEEDETHVRSIESTIECAKAECQNPGAYNKPETCILTGVDGEQIYLNVDSDPFRIDHIKPYLRPMSSMTGEEKKIYMGIGSHLCGEIVAKTMIDWLNEHHFDYRGLIERGLALEAPENMYKQD